MRRNGPNVWQTCAVCGASVETATTIQEKYLPAVGGGTHVIIVPLVIHLQDGTGGHITAHPAMTIEQMGMD